MTYAGNKLFNFNNSIVVLILLIGLVYVIAVPNFDPNIVMAFAVTILFGLFVIALGAFYFEITTDELIIKNYMIPFFNIKYKLSEITLVQFLDAKAAAKAKVKIIQKNQRSLGIGYTASSLRINDWQLFIDELLSRNIPIKIDSIGLQKIAINTLNQ